MTKTHDCLSPTHIGGRTATFRDITTGELEARALFLNCFISHPSLAQKLANGEGFG